MSLRLGSLAEIFYFQGVIEGVLGSDSILCQQVLTTRSHCGDEIKIEMLSQLLRELSTLVETFQDTQPDITVFALPFKNFVALAIEKQRPIIFT